jgi:hypothetical protein
MAGSGKKKTTMAKIMRESRLRERRAEKAAKKEARKNAPAESSMVIGDALNPATGEPFGPDELQSSPEPVVQPHAEA